MANPWDNDPIVQQPAPSAAAPWESDPVVQQSQSGDLSADNASRAVATGVPIIGGLLNKADAATNAFLAPVVDPLLPDSFQKLPGQTFGDRYQEALDIQNGKDQAFHQEHPYVDTGLQVAGGIASTAPAVAAAPGLFGLGQGSRLAKTGASMLSGMTIGGADSAVRSDLDPKQTATGAVIGLGAGAVAPVIGNAIGSAVRSFTAPADAASAFAKPAQQYLRDAMGDPDKISALRDALMRLGPDATLADVSPEWMGVARGAASQPGNRDAIVQPLLDRASGANQRLATDLDASLGSPVVPSRVDAALQQGQQDIGPAYREAFQGATPYDVQPIADAIDADINRLRGPAQAALRQVRGMLNINGTGQLSADPRVMFETRQAIDGMLNGEQNVKTISALTDARQMLDDALTRAVPNIKEADASYAELARQREALQQGRPILNNGATALRPQEVADMVEQGVQPQGMQIGPSAVPLRLQQGVRAEIDRAAGTNAVDTTAVRKIVRGDGDWNRQKLATLFGQDNADQALNAIDRETTFGNTANRVTAGSDTAMASRFGDMLDEVATPKEIPADTTLTGLGLRAGHKVLTAALEDQAEKMGARFANDLGGMAVASGDRRDALVAALAARAGVPTSDPRIAALVAAMTQEGGRRLSANFGSHGR